MVRQNAMGRTSFAGSAGPRDRAECARHVVARDRHAVLRVALAPLVALGVALAGMLFVILMPICGIATIAEEVARHGWRFLRATAMRVAPPREGRS